MRSLLTFLFFVAYVSPIFFSRLVEFYARASERPRAIGAGEIPSAPRTGELSQGTGPSEMPQSARTGEPTQGTGTVETPASVLFRRAA